MLIVTGGAGFIGSALIWKLNETGHDDILVVDRMGTGIKWKNLAKRRFLTIQHKESFFGSLDEEIDPRDVDAIIHMGASSSTTETDVDYLVANNLNYSVHLWEYCARHEIPFIYASSAATYGDGSQGFEDDPARVHELQAMNPYGFSKQKFDSWAMRQKSAPPFWAGLKFFNVYGPHEYHKGGQASVIYHFVPQVEADGVIRLFKSYRDDVPHGEQKRDFVYVKDCVDVIVHLLESVDTAKSGVYNVGTGLARTFSDLARAVFHAMDRPENIQWIDMPHELKAQYQYFTEASLANLREKTGYDKPFTSLEEGVREYVNKYLTADDQYL